MTELITFILISFGLTQIIVYGDIFNKIRPDIHFFHCSMCMGFWTGILIALSSLNSKLLFTELTLVDILLLGLLSSGTSYIIDMVIGDYGINIINNKKQ